MYVSPEKELIARFEMIRKCYKVSVYKKTMVLMMMTR